MEYVTDSTVIVRAVANRAGGCMPRWLFGITHDLRLGFRALRGTPVVSVAAILSVALGIGANTTIFSLVNSLLLRSLPVRDPAQLAIVANVRQDAPAWSNPIWEEIRNRGDLFAGAFAWSADQFNLTSGGEAQFIEGLWASGEVFEVLGIQASFGRTFTAADDRRGGGPDGPVAVISHDFWRRHFGGSADAIGKPLMLDSVAFTVIGVTPQRFFGPEVGRRFDVAVPIGAEPLLRRGNSALDLAGRLWLRIMVRLRADQSADRAAAGLRAVQPQVVDAALGRAQQPQLAEFLRTPFTLTPASTGRSTLRAQYGRPLLMLLAVACGVLLIACVNIANLMLARGAARRHEMSVRVALGASRLRLSRLLLAEAAVVSGVGALLGFVLSQWMRDLLVSQLVTEDGAVFLDLPSQWYVLGYTTFVATATTIFFGMVPAWQATRAHPVDALVDRGHGRIGGVRSPIAFTLVSAQVALSLMLVVAAGLFVRTFTGLVFRDLGFTADRVLVVNLNARATQYRPPQLVSVYDRVLQAVSGVPGVERAALSDITPVSGSSRMAVVEVSGGAPLAPGDQMTNVNVISPGWLATYGIRLIAGRDFTPTDRSDAPPVALVNEAFVRRFLGSTNAIGRLVAVGAPGAMTKVQIVGLVEDAVYESLRESPPPTLFTSTTQRPAARPAVNVSILVADGSPVALSRSVAAAISQVDRGLVLQSRTLAQQLEDGMSQERLVALLSGFFGALALLLAAVGLYGVTAYGVSRRRAEIAMRLALGVERIGVIRLILRRVAVALGGGIIVGTVASLWASRFAEALVWGIEARDPATFVGAAVVLSTIGALAGWLPAWRASRMDPALVLRE